MHHKLPKFNRRLLLRADFPQIAIMDSKVSKETLTHYMQNPFNVAEVLEEGLHVCAYFVYRMFKERMKIIRLVVAPSKRRRGIGQRIIKMLARSAKQHGRSMLTISVPETNLGAQLFLRECGFTADYIIYYDSANLGEDHYFMQLPVQLPCKGR